MTQNVDLSWKDGVPIADRFDDPYYSLTDGLAETRHVFLKGNDLPDRFDDSFHIAELGFGTGLNLLAAWAAWEAAGQTTRLNFTSFEAFPMDPSDMAAALTPWPELAEKAAEMTAQLAKRPYIQTPTLAAQIIIGDARETLPNWKGKADAWFLDGFSPAKNPELWEPALMATVAQHTKPKGTCATYTAAGHVRRALEAAGFDVTRASGFAHKRHMTRGILGDTYAGA